MDCNITEGRVFLRKKFRYELFGLFNEINLVDIIHDLVQNIPILLAPRKGGIVSTLVLPYNQGLVNIPVISTVKDLICLSPAKFLVYYQNGQVDLQLMSPEQTTFSLGLSNITPVVTLDRSLAFLLSDYEFSIVDLVGQFQVTTYTYHEQISAATASNNVLYMAHGNILNIMNVIPVARTRSGAKFLVNFADHNDLKGTIKKLKFYYGYLYALVDNNLLVLDTKGIIIKKIRGSINDFFLSGLFIVIESEDNPALIITKKGSFYIRLSDKILKVQSSNDLLYIQTANLLRVYQLSTRPLYVGDILSPNEVLAFTLYI
jgi:hypothetical protein